MKKQTVGLVVLLAMLVTLVIPNISLAQNTDPASVYKAMTDALNAHNAGTAGTFFADNAVVTLASQVYVGKTAILNWLQDMVAQNIHDDIGKPLVSNDSLLIQDSLTTDAFTNLGVSPVAFNIQVVVTNGQITAYVARVAPRSVASLVAAAPKVNPPGADAVVAALRVAEAADDVQAEATYYADDAIIITPSSLTSSGIFSGTAAIMTYLQNQADQHVTVDGGIDLLISPGVVLATARVSNDNWLKLGIQSLDVYSYIVVRNGKIEQQIINLTSASALKLAAALAK